MAATILLYRMESIEIEMLSRNRITVGFTVSDKVKKRQSKLAAALMGPNLAGMGRAVSPSAMPASTPGPSSASSSSDLKQQVATSDSEGDNSDDDSSKQNNLLYWYLKASLIRLSSTSNW